MPRPPILRSLKGLVPERHRPALKRLAGLLVAPFYAGDRFECPCCGGRFRKMRDFRPEESREYVGLRRNAECPRCSSLERHRLLWLFLQRKTNLFTARLRVLCVAPEELLQSALLRLPNLDYLSVDLDSPLAMEHIDVTRIPYADDRFDVVLCNHVLEHIPEDVRAMGELRRVLRPGGWALLQTPIDTERATTYEDPRILGPEERARHFGQSDHVRIYGRDYVDRLRAAGFDVRAIDFRKELGGEQVARFSLGYVDDVYWCTKGPAVSGRDGSPDPGPAG
jgi:hypothetical protein